MNKTNENPAFIMNTGVVKNVFISFFINDFVDELDFIFNLSTLTFLFDDTFFKRELILK